MTREVGAKQLVRDALELREHQLPEHRLAATALTVSMPLIASIWYEW